MSGHPTTSNEEVQSEVKQQYGGSQMILPRVDNGRSLVPLTVPRIGLTFHIDLRHLYYAVGAGVPTFMLGAAASPNTVGALGAGAGVGLAAASGSAKVDRTIDTPIGLALSRLRELTTTRSFSLDSDEIFDYWSGGVPIHGIKRIFDDGTLEMWDGRLVTFIGMAGPNTEMATDSSIQSKSDGLTAGIRGDIEGDFSWYMTTGEELVDDFVELYKDTAYSERYAGDEFEMLREYLHDKIDYEQNVEPGRWRTREILTYAVVEVSPSEAQSASEQALSRVDQLREAMPGMTPTATGDEHSARISRQLQKRLDTRVDNMVGALTGTDGVEMSDVYRAGPTEVAMLASSYWGGSPIDMSVPNSGPSPADLSVWPSITEASSDKGPKSHRPTPVERQIEREHDTSNSELEGIIAGIERVDALSDDGTEATQEMQSPSEDDAGTPEEVFEGDTTSQQIAEYGVQLREHLLGDDGYEVDVGDSNLAPEQTAIAPTQFKTSEDGEYLVVGDEYVKTFWVTGWAPTPTPNLLEGLKRHEKLHPDSNSRANDVKFDMTIRMQDISRKEAKEYLAKVRNKLGIEIEDDPDEISTASLDSAADYYKAMSFLLETMPSLSPWRINGYVTVRAGEKQGIEEARHQLEQGYVKEDDADANLGRREVLDDTKDALFEALKSTSPGLIIRDEPGHIDTLFKSGFPASNDLYDQVKSVDRYQLSLSGSVGAMLPFKEKVPQEPNGVEYGRHRATGLKMYADHFQRGKAPHGIGIGDSGSSKTFSKGMQYLQWFLKEEGRTVVVADTMGGFRQFMDLLGDQANHIPVDSSTTVNPFAISAVTGATRGEDVQPGEMTFESAKEWLLNEVENQGGNPDEFKQTVEQLITKMYDLHDIDIDDPSTFDNGDPNMADFVETMDYLEENPEEATLGSSNSEIDDIVAEVKGLKRNLAGFSKLGRNSHMMGESDVSLEPGKFNYLDLESVESSSGGASESAMLQLMLKQVYELVKIAPKETVFLVDEAHLLLRTKWSLKFLSNSGVHWRHFLGRIDAISHRPGEFISGPEDPENLKDRFRSQAATTEFWNVDTFKREHAEEFFTGDSGNFNEDRYKYVKNQAVTGESDKPFSTSIVKFADLDGWYTNHIRSGPIVTAFHSWEPDDHGPFEPYFQAIIDGYSIAEYEDLYEAGETPAQLESQSEATTPEPVSPPQPAATDGGTNQPEERPRDEKGRFISTEGDD